MIFYEPGRDRAQQSVDSQKKTRQATKEKKKKDKKYDQREIPSAPYIGVPVTLLRDCTH